jgi:uncharacterized protein
MTDYPITALNKVQRLAKRGVYDRETVHCIIDEAPICHVGFVADDRPFVIPTIHARMGETVVLHGAPASRMLKQGQKGELCLTFTLLDGLVLARSVFHSSMNYRSAVVFGQGRLLETREEKLEALTAVVEHVMPGRSQEARRPTEKEIDSTTVIAVEIASASAKVRTGGPGDDEEDYVLPIWAGVVPMGLTAQSALPDERLLNGLHVPGYVQDYIEANTR